MDAKTKQAALLANDCYDKRDPGEQMTIDGITYEVLAVADKKSGYQAVAYQRQDTGEVIIAHRGTEFDREPHKDGVIADGPMVLKSINSQYDDAVAFTRRTIALARASEARYGHPIAICITGHSLGGTLTQLMCHRYNLPGITFNAYGAAGLGYKLPEGGSLVQNHVVATDLISATSPHGGQVHVYMSQRDVDMLERGRYLGSAQEGTEPNPFLTANSVAHRMGNFLPGNEFHGASIISRENELRARAYAPESSRFRAQVMQTRLTAASCSRKLLSHALEAWDIQAMGKLMEQAHEGGLESDPIKSRLAAAAGYRTAATDWMQAEIDKAWLAITRAAARMATQEASHA